MLDGRSMAICYHRMNFPRYLFGAVNKHRVHLKDRLSSSALRGKPTSLVLQTRTDDDEPGPRNFESNSLSSGAGSDGPMLAPLPNTVGVIGGISAVSTLNFLQKLVRWSSGDGEDSIPFIVCNDPLLSRLLSFQGRCSSSYQTYIVDNLRCKRLFLERSGARCIVMPCHISHTWYDQISEGCSVPFLHVGESVAQELKAAKLKPVEAGSSLHIGLLSTDAILHAGFYQEKLYNQGFEVVLPDTATMEHTVIPAMEAFKKRDMEGARNLLRIALHVLLVRAANTVILANDDMCGLLPPDDPLRKKCTYPIDALVRSTILWANLTGKSTDVT